MLDIETIAAIVFLIILSLFLIANKKKLTVHKILYPLVYFVMYKTRLGIKTMDAIAGKSKKIIRYLGYVAIAIGFLGMIALSFGLLQSAYSLISKPGAAPGVGIVLPFKVKGAFYVPFFYWLISIFILAVVHEFSHGVMARAFGLKIKSSGFAFLGLILPILPAAFVEPDEKELSKRPWKEQLSVFAAGPFSNIAFAAILFVLSLFLVGPFILDVVEFTGVKVVGLEENYPASLAGITENETIVSVDNIEIVEVSNFSGMLENKTAGDTILVTTDKGIYNLTLAPHPEAKEKGYLGIYVAQETAIGKKAEEKYGSFLPILLWFTGTPLRHGLLGWLILLNFGIGLFNLVPIGPIDGGRMLKTTLLKFFKEEKADKIWKNIGLFFLFLLLVNIVFAFVR